MCWTQRSLFFFLVDFPLFLFEWTVNFTRFNYTFLRDKKTYTAKSVKYLGFFNYLFYFWFRRLTWGLNLILILIKCKEIFPYIVIEENTINKRKATLWFEFIWNLNIDFSLSYIDVEKFLYTLPISERLWICFLCQYGPQLLLDNYCYVWSNNITC